MPPAIDQSPEFLDWRRDPDRSAAGAVIGLVLSWIFGGALVLGMLDIQSATAPVSGTEFVLWMSAPLAVGGAACGSRRVRYWRGAVVLGALAGWLLGLLTLLG
ncbi:hypothetical protein, partial [Nocardioides taihuensis]